MKIIIPLLTVAMVTSIILAGCAPVPSQPVEQPLPAQPEPPPSEVSEPPVPAPTPVALPRSGEWAAATGTTEFTFTFMVNLDSTGIPQYTYEFEEFGFCGDYRVGKMTLTISRGEPIPINPLPSGAEFSFVDNHKVYSGEDSTGILPGHIYIFWHMVIEGKFEETGTHASGTWEVSSAGKVITPLPPSEGTTCQEGTWEASAP